MDSPPILQGRFVPNSINGSRRNQQILAPSSTSTQVPRDEFLWMSSFPAWSCATGIPQDVDLVALGPAV